MTDNEEKVLDALSQIDDDIVERVGEKRYELMHRGWHKRDSGHKMWIAGLSAVACLCLVMIPLFIFLFGGPNSGIIDSNGKQIPVYEGVTVSSAPLNSLSTDDHVLRAVPLSSNSITADDISNAIEDFYNNYINKDNDTSSGDNGPQIEDTGKDLYYARTNEDIYITIHLKNPDNFTILSFILNGKTYASYMFEEGSDMETLILKYNVGDVEGYQKYTVDAVKYVDGTDIKDAIMEGNRVVNIGVLPSKQPTADVTSTVIDFDSISFDAIVSDELELVSLSGGELYAYLIDGNEVSMTQKLEVGEMQNVCFKGLNPGETYSIGIAAMYDDLTGKGFDVHNLYSRTIDLLCIVSVAGLNSSEEQVEFSLDWNENFTGEILSCKAELLLDGNVVSSIEVDTLGEFTGLLSKTDYAIRFTYTYSLDGIESEGFFATDFTTIAKIPPQVPLSFDIGADKMIFNSKITDEDGTFLSAKLVIYDKEELISTIVLSKDQDRYVLDGLKTNHEYSIILTYRYDLNNGNGAIEHSYPFVKTTESLMPPQVPLSFEIGTNKIIFNSKITDEDGTFLSAKLVIYDEEELINTIILSKNQDRYVLDGLKTNHEYSIILTYRYDLNNGNGVIEHSEKFVKKTEPEITVVGHTLDATEYFKGETAKLSLKIINESDLIIQSVTINGTSYDAKMTDDGMLHLSVKMTDAIGYGSCTLTVEELKNSLDGGVIKPSNSYEIKVFVYEPPTLISVEYTDSNFDRIYFATEKDDVYQLFTFVNPTGCKIVSLEGFPSLTRIDDERYYCVIPDRTMMFEGKYNAYKGIKISYSLNEGSIRNVQTGSYKYYGGINSSAYNIKYISTAEELLDIDDGYYYIQTRDIDLAGVEWTPPILRGVYDGNGFSVKNLSFSTDVSSDQFVGLFRAEKNYECIVKNLILKNLDVDLRVVGGRLNYGGILVDGGEQSAVIDCTVDESSSVKIRVLFDGDVERVCGIADACLVANCINRSTIDSDSGDIFGIGGVKVYGCLNYGNLKGKNVAGVGSARSTGFRSEASIIFDSDNYGDLSAVESCCGIAMFGNDYGIIQNCVNNGDISGSVAGGIVARTVESTGGGTVVLECENYGAVLGAVRSGGIVAYAGCTSKIIHCANYGKIDASSTTCHTGGICGFLGESVEIEGCSNYGDVSEASTSIAGSIIGYSRFYGTVKNCVNYGQAPWVFLGGYFSLESSCVFIDCRDERIED